MIFTSTLNTARRGAIAAATFVACSVAQAEPFDLTLLSLSFTEPTGTALSTDTIDVYLSLKLSADAGETFTFDSTAGAPYALGELLPTQSVSYDDEGVATYTDFAQYSYANLGTWFGCSGNFTDEQCPSGTTTYNFEWGSLPETLTLNPGETFTYRFGTFTPKNGFAPAGSYTFNFASLAVFVYGLDIDGNSISADLTLASTSEPAFTREVVSVPEPESYAMALGALGLIGFVARRRRAI